MEQPFGFDLGGKDPQEPLEPITVNEYKILISVISAQEEEIEYLRNLVTQLQKKL